jgi:hypothetical protein
MNNRRDFLKKSALAGGAFSALSIFPACGKTEGNVDQPFLLDESVQSKLIVPTANALPISGTFLDEISHDIPHQNWGEKEWDLDFRYMKSIGIDTVIMIRSGYRKFITYPSSYLLKKG